MFVSIYNVVCAYCSWDKLSLFNEVVIKRQDKE